MVGKDLAVTQRLLGLSPKQFDREIGANAKEAVLRPRLQRPVPRPGAAFGQNRALPEMPMAQIETFFEAQFRRSRKRRGTERHF